MRFSFDQPFIVVAAVIEHDGKYLLIQENHMPDKGTWNLPAGKLDMGEGLVGAVRREVFEEAGLDFTAQYLVGIHSIVRRDVPGRSTDLQTVRFVFGGTVQGNVVIGLGDGTEAVPEIADYKWLSNEAVQLLPNSELRYHDTKQLIADHAVGVRYPLNILGHYEQG